ncbi:MAG: SdpI family protein [Mucilaginibacter sp.]
MKKFNSLDAAAIVIWLLPAAYLLYIFPTLPASVPVHFGIEGTPDRYGSKGEFLITFYILMGTSLFVYLLMKVLPAIDPKKMVKFGEATFQKMALGIVLFFSALTIAIIFSTINRSFKIDKLILPIIGLLFAFMGNIMHSIKPNYFFGLKTPWTLEDNDTWRATHRLAGKLWFVGGIVLTIAVLLLPSKAGFIVFMSMVGVLTLIPIIYSYIYYKKHHTLNQNS